MEGHFMKSMHLFGVAAQLVSLLIFLPCAGFAAEPGQDSQDLEQAANDPTASLMSVQIQNVYRRRLSQPEGRRRQYHPPAFGGSL